MTKLASIFAGMKKLVSVIILSCAAFTALAQKTFWEKPDYGVSFRMNLPAIKGDMKDTVSMKAEWGTSVFFEFGNKKAWAYQSSLGFDRVKYNHNIEHFTVLNSTVNLGLAAIYSPAAMQGTSFQFGLEPNYILSRKLESIDGSKGSGISQTTSEIDDPFDLGFRAGINIQFKPHVAFSISYKEMLLGKPNNHGYEGLPDQIQVGLKLTFSQIKNLNAVDYRGTALREVNRLKDSSVMIFVLESRKGDAEQIEDEVERKEFEERIAQVLDSQMQAVREFYNFSDYAFCFDTSLRTLLDGNIELALTEVSNAGNPALQTGNFFICRIGEFVISDNQSTRSGAFVFDNGMNLYKAPFPFYTPYVGLEHYMDDRRKLNAMISRLNERLHLLSKMQAQ